MTLVFAAEPAFSEHQFKMHSGHDPETPVAKWMSLVYEEVFRRLDIPMQIYFLPNKRGSMMTETGELDGQFGRIYEYQNLFEHQLRVNEATVTMNINSWVRADSELAFENGWDSLKDTDLRIEHVRGVVVSEKNLKPIIRKDLLSTSSYVSDGLEHLKFQLTDVFVHGDLGVYPHLLRSEYKNLIVPAGTLAQVNLYPYLHASHAELIPKMEQVIRDIKQDGSYLAFCMEAFGEESEPFCLNVIP